MVDFVFGRLWTGSSLGHVDDGRQNTVLIRVGVEFRQYFRVRVTYARGQGVVPSAKTLVFVFE